MTRTALQLVGLPTPATPPAATFAAAVATAAGYQRGGANRCPHCSATAFHVGRVTAECASCGNALPIAPDRKPCAHPTIAEERI